MNHDYIGSFWQCQMNQKPGTYVTMCKDQFMFVSVPE